MTEPPPIPPDPAADPHADRIAERPGRGLGDDLDVRLGELGDFIRGQREAARQSIRDLARRAGVSNPYLSQIERGLRRPSAEILQQIARALSISAETLYVRAGILDADADPVVSVPEAIERDPHLTAEQKQTLLTVYRSFVDRPGGASDR